MEPFIMVETGDGVSVFHRFLNRILESATVDEISGQFVCRVCGVTLDIDWFEKDYECMCE